MIFKAIFLTATIALVTGCQPIQNLHGHVVDKDTVKNLLATQATPAEVAEKMGTPSCVLFYDPNTWYYLGQEITQEAFFKPQVTQVDCYALTFSPQGRLCATQHSDRHIDLKISDQATPLPSEHGGSVLQQFFRNVGRFPSVKMSKPF